MQMDALLVQQHIGLFLTVFVLINIFQMIPLKQLHVFALMDILLIYKEFVLNAMTIVSPAILMDV
jgi:hypothetical protein